MHVHVHVYVIYMYMYMYVVQPTDPRGSLDDAVPDLVGQRHVLLYQSLLHHRVLQWEERGEMYVYDDIHLPKNYITCTCVYSEPLYWGPGKASCIERCSHFRGTEKHIQNTTKGPG